jgi:hypothetical protein
MENERSPSSQLIKPVKLATPVSPTPVKFDHTFAEAANSYYTLHGRYSISCLFILNLGHSFMFSAFFVYIN